MKVIYRLSALTAEGLGGKDKYVELVAIDNSIENLLAARRNFAIKYGVDLDMVECQVWSR